MRTKFIKISNAKNTNFERKNKNKNKKISKILVLTAATVRSKSSRIPDSAEDEYPIYKALPFCTFKSNA